MRLCLEHVWIGSLAILCIPQANSSFKQKLIGKSIIQELVSDKYLGQGICLGARTSYYSPLFTSAQSLHKRLFPPCTLSLPQSRQEQTFCICIPCETNCIDVQAKVA